MSVTDTGVTRKEYEKRKKPPRITTEFTVKLFLRLIPILIIALALVFFGILPRFFQLDLGDIINLFLSSVIGLFAIVAGVSSYLRVMLEKEKARLQEIRDEIEKVYAPIFRIFREKQDYMTARAGVPITSEEKTKMDSVIIEFPHLLVPDTLSLWEEFIEHLEPYKTQPTTIFLIPMPFISHISIAHDNLLDEYHWRTGKGLLEKPSWMRRLARFKF